jgi:hypothetical protein
VAISTKNIIFFKKCFFQHSSNLRCENYILCPMTLQNILIGCLLLLKPYFIIFGEKSWGRINYKEGVKIYLFPHKMTNFSKKVKKLFFSKTVVNPFRKQFQFFLKNNFFSTRVIKIPKSYPNMLILPQKYLKCV